MRPDPLAQAMQSGVLAVEAPRGSAAPFLGWMASHLGHPSGGRPVELTYLPGAPAVLADLVTDLAAGYAQLKEELSAPAPPDGTPAFVTLVSRATHRRPQQADLKVTRSWSLSDFPLAADGAGAAADPACCGLNGAVQSQLSQLDEFEQLVRDVRARFTNDCIWPCIRSERLRPQRVVYSFECCDGCVRSVACVELLAHMFHAAAGVANVAVVHEDLDTRQGPSGQLGSCGCPNSCGSLRARGLRTVDIVQRTKDWLVQLSEARERARSAWTQWHEYDGSVVAN